MHASSLWHMQDCVDRHLQKQGVVLDVGAKRGKRHTTDHREIFEKRNWKYVGLDLVAGPNVDVVLDDPFDWPLDSDSYDAVISGQMLEHNSMFWITFLEMARVTKAGGYMIHIAPSRGREHLAPQDCWRLYRGGMRALAEWCGLDVIEATTDWTKEDARKMKKRNPALDIQSTLPVELQNSQWGDTVGVFRKPPEWSPSHALRLMQKQIAKIS